MLKSERRSPRRMKRATAQRRRSRRLKEVIANTKLALDLDPDRADDPE